MLVVALFVIILIRLCTCIISSLAFTWLPTYYYYASVFHTGAFGYYSGGLVSRVKELALPLPQVHIYAHV